MKRIRKNEFEKSDTARRNDLARQHGLHFKRSGMVYRFDGTDQKVGAKFEHEGSASVGSRETILNC